MNKKTRQQRYRRSRELREAIWEEMLSYAYNRGMIKSVKAIVTDMKVNVPSMVVFYNDGSKNTLMWDDVKAARESFPSGEAE